MTEKEQLRPIGQKSIVEQIIDSMMDAIVGGVYRPGTKLPSEFELMEQMQVGRNSLREAMKVLSAMGIVEIKRGDGTYISTQMNASACDRVIYSMVYDAGMRPGLSHGADRKLQKRVLYPHHEGRLQRI